MKMHRVRQPRIVDEPHHCFGPLLHDERRTWGDAIIAPKRSLTTIGVDLGLELLDVNLVVEDVLSGDGVWDGPGLMSVGV